MMRRSRDGRMLVSSALCFLGLAVCGLLSAAEPQYPLAIAAEESGAIFLADRELPGIWKLADEKLSILFQGSKKFRTPLNAVRSLAIDIQGRLLVGDSATRDVYRLDGDKPVPLANGRIGVPACIAVTKAGDLLVGDLEAHTIWKIPAAGGEPAVWAELPAPRAIFVDGQDRVWIVSHGKDQLLRGDASAKVEPVIAGRPFEFPSAIAVDAEGTAFVCDTYAKAVWKVPAGGQPEKWATGEPLVSPVGMTWQGADLLVVDPHSKAVVRIDPAAEMSKIDLTAGAK
jgi:sugar lactone lactonase YvrE